MNTGPSAIQLFDAAVDVYESGDAARALAMAEDLLRQHPGHGGALYMTGTLLLHAGRAAEALPRLEAAVATPARNGESLQMLGDAYFQLSRWPEAAAAYQAARAGGRGDTSLLNRLGMALKEMGDVNGAVHVFETALLVAPDDADLHSNLAIALNRRQDYRGAIAAYQRALELAPRNVDIWSNLATLLEQSNLLEEAEAAVQSGLAIDPQDQRLQMVSARCLRRRGELDTAIALLERNLLRGDLERVVHRTMEFELGKAYDLKSDAASAFPHFMAGNALTAQVWPGLRAGADAFQEQLRHHLDVATADWIARLPPGPTEERPSPVFLVSFPRSGTTLLDTMLDAHPGICVLEEEPILGGIAERLQSSSGYPEALAQLSDSDIRGLREEYWHGVGRVLGDTDDAGLVLDKYPLYSMHAGLIHRLFPGARFIFALRHPCDTVLSCFMQAFGNVPVLENFRDLETTALTYARVMDLWTAYRAGLDLKVHMLRYEALLQDKQAELTALLGFLGLEWDESMQDHTRHARKRGRIYTPSYHQVVKPLYGDAVDRWQKYRPYFGAALDKLRPYAEGFGYRS